MKPIDNWADAARKLNEDTRELAKGTKAAFEAVQTALVAAQAVMTDLNARLAKLEDAARAAADTGWKFSVGDRLIEPDNPHPYDVTGRYHENGARRYVLDNWYHTDESDLIEDGWARP